MQEYHLECPQACSLREGTKWSSTVNTLLLEGASYRSIIATLAAKKGSTNLAVLTRHKKHIILATDESDQGQTALASASNIEILEAIIQKGFGNQKNWKPTISDMMKAMDMWFKLTQGNPFDELLDTLAAAGMEDEAPDAEGLPDEREDLIDS